MTVRRDARTPAPSGVTRFDERLSVPWWWWPLPLVVIFLVVVSMRLGHPQIPWEVSVVVLAPLAALALIRLGRHRVSVRELDSGERILQVGSARLSDRFIAGVVAIDRADKQRALGPELDPSAFVLHKPWIGPVVRVDLNDPEDPTPYWLFSVRHPDAVVAALKTPHPR